MDEHIPLAAIELAERHSEAAAAFSLASLDDARRRANALLLVLVAGGGGLGGVGLARAGDSPMLGWPALVCAAYWFALSAVVAWRAVTSAEVRAWATTGLLLQYPAWAQYAHEVNAEARARGQHVVEVDASQELRKSAIENCEAATTLYRVASARAMRVIDGVYRAAALTPCVGAAAAAQVYFLG